MCPKNRYPNDWILARVTAFATCPSNWNRWRKNSNPYTIIWSVHLVLQQCNTFDFVPATISARLHVLCIQLIVFRSFLSEWWRRMKLKWTWNIESANRSGNPINRHTVLSNFTLHTMLKFLRNHKQINDVGFRMNFRLFHAAPTKPTLLNNTETLANETIFYHRYHAARFMATTFACTSSGQSLSWSIHLPFSRDETRTPKSYTKLWNTRSKA